VLRDNYVCEEKDLFYQYLIFLQRIMKIDPIVNHDVDLMIQRPPGCHPYHSRAIAEEEEDSLTTTPANDLLRRSVSLNVQAPTGKYPGKQDDK
jgi:hypothetical protein